MPKKITLCRNIFYTSDYELKKFGKFKFGRKKSYIEIYIRRYLCTNIPGVGNYAKHRKRVRNRKQRKMKTYKIKGHLDKISFQ